ncbi:MAG: hypothetical protein ABSD03_14275 [Vulcanimicrobiaceae bacterium]
MTTARDRFPIHALLSVYTGTLAGDFGECHRLIEHLVDSPVWTHQLPQVMREGRCQAALLEQFPRLADVPKFERGATDEGDALRAAVTAWVESARAILGADYVTVRPLAEPPAPLQPLAGLEVAAAQGRVLMVGVGDEPRPDSHREAAR